MKEKNSKNVSKKEDLQRKMEVDDFNPFGRLEILQIIMIFYNFDF